MTLASCSSTPPTRNVCKINSDLQHSFVAVQHSQKGIVGGGVTEIDEVASDDGQLLGRSLGFVY